MSGACLSVLQPPLYCLSFASEMRRWPACASSAAIGYKMLTDYRDRYGRVGRAGVRF